MRDRNVLAPCEVRRSCQNETQRKHHQGKRRKIEELRVFSLLVPPDELFRCETESQHHELKIKPIRLEQEEKVRTEDDRKRKEAECIGVSPRPRQQQFEGIRKYQLRDHQVERVVYLPPVPAP